MTTQAEPTTSTSAPAGTPMHVVLLSITMWTLLTLGLIGVMVVFLMN
jgi:hypothetical protein